MVPGSSPARGEILSNRKDGSIAHNLSFSPSHHSYMTKILLNRTLNCKSSIHLQFKPPKSEKSSGETQTKRTSNVVRHRGLVHLDNKQLKLSVSTLEDTSSKENSEELTQLKPRSEPSQSVEKDNKKSDYLFHETD